MSTNRDYAQFMRKYRLLIVDKKSKSTTYTTAPAQTTPTPSETKPPVAETSPATTTSAGWKGQCTGGTVNVRRGPSTSYRSYGTVKKGTKFAIYSKKNGWYEISYSKGADGKGWMSGKYVKVTSGGEPDAATDTSVPGTTPEPNTTETVTVIDKATIDVSNLRCVFVCEKSTTDTPNYSQIAVYNLSQDTIAQVKAGDTVILEAGYENGNYGMIFTGQIVQPYTAKEDNTDDALVLIVQDGDVYLNNSFIMQTIAKSATQADIARTCIGEEAAEGIITDALSERQLSRGKVLFGKPSDYLSQIANSNQSQFYLEDGKINIVSATDYASTEAVELNPATGLIGMPSQTDDGVSGQCLINPSIKLNTLVYINQKLIAQKQVGQGETTYAAISTDGIYRIVKLTYEGDTHGDAWYCTFEAVTQSGKKPAGLTNDGTNPWR